MNPKPRLRKRQGHWEYFYRVGCVMKGQPGMMERWGVGSTVAAAVADFERSQVYAYRVAPGDLHG